MLRRREFLRAAPTVPREGRLLHVHRRAMACRFEVTLPGDERGGVESACAALDEVDRLEVQLSVFHESSEVIFINRRAAAGPVKIDESLFALLRQCADLHCETEGAFDITSGPLTRCWGFFRRQGRIPDEDEIALARESVGSEKMLFDCESRSIEFACAGLEINLGSIGKGYALDRAASVLNGRVRSALLSGGSSSMLAMGHGDYRRSGWLVGIRHPNDLRRRMATVRLCDAALSTSGSEEQFFEHAGRRYGHIIDPRTGAPSDKVSGVTVIARSAAVCDALSTAFFVGGRELAERYCEAHGDVLVLMLESGSCEPVLLGNRDLCEVEILDE